jgi:hypothetical protein
MWGRPGRGQSEIISKQKCSSVNPGKCYLCGPGSDRAVSSQSVTIAAAEQFHSDDTFRCVTTEQNRFSVDDKNNQSRHHLHPAAHRSCDTTAEGAPLSPRDTAHTVVASPAACAAPPSAAAVPHPCPAAQPLLTSKKRAQLATQSMSPAAQAAARTAALTRHCSHNSLAPHVWRSCVTASGA